LWQLSRWPGGALWLKAEGMLLMATDDHHHIHTLKS
jgi:hypothetical protein